MSVNLLWSACKKRTSDRSLIKDGSEYANPSARRVTVRATSPSKDFDFFLADLSGDGLVEIEIGGVLAFAGAEAALLSL